MLQKQFLEKPVVRGGLFALGVWWNSDDVTWNRQAGGESAVGTAAEEAGEAAW